MSATTVNTQSIVSDSGTELWILEGKAVDPDPPPAPTCKRGVAYGDWQSTSDFAALSKGITWYYEWSPLPDSISVASGLSSVSITNSVVSVEFVPMIWGENDMDLLDNIPEGAQYLLGFNEPNFMAQSNLTGAQAAALWTQIQAVADQRNIKLVSPAVNYCGSPCIDTDPVAWLDQFFAACINCRVDFIGVHSYVCEVDYLITYIGLFKKYGKPIWLTEFSCGDQGSQPIEVQEQYMAAALQYLESDVDIFRYAWFSGRSTEIPTSNLLSDQPGVLNNLGIQYISNPQCPTAGSILESTAEPREIADGWLIGSFVILILAIVVFVVVYLKRKKDKNEKP